MKGQCYESRVLHMPLNSATFPTSDAQPQSSQSGYMSSANDIKAKRGSHVAIQQLILPEDTRCNKVY